MTRTVDDASLLYQVMAGRNSLDIERDLKARQGLFGLNDIGIKGVRFGALSKLDRQVVDSEILHLYDEAVGLLESMGAVPSIFNMPVEYEEIRQIAGTVISAEGYYYHGSMFENAKHVTDPHVRARILSGRRVSSTDYISALRTRQEHQAKVLDRMKGYSAIVTPTVSTPAIPITDINQDLTPAHFTRAANYLGFCALSVPMGLTESGLPVALQIMARHGRESEAIRLGASFERKRGSIGHPNRIDALL